MISYKEYKQLRKDMPKNDVICMSCGHTWTPKEDEFQICFKCNPIEDQDTEIAHKPSTPNYWY